MPQKPEAFSKAEISSISKQLDQLSGDWASFLDGAAKDVPDDAGIWASGKNAIKLGLSALTMTLARFKKNVNQPGFGDPKLKKRKKRRENGNQIAGGAR